MTDILCLSEEMTDILCLSEDMTDILLNSIFFSLETPPKITVIQRLLK